jgi:catechol 2,3-dioxygenase-like lactoylglutathione lyase family enzyme
MATDPIQPPEGALPWHGIHHIALATRNLDATITFYRDVLGMVVSDVFPSREGRGRHCLIFVKPGDCDIWGLHFFERAASEPVGSRRSEPPTASEGPLLHIAFRLPDNDAARTLRERLRQHGVAITEIEELGTFVFWDSNGMMLEVTWPHA